MVEEIENLALRVAGPASVNGHAGYGKGVQNDGYQAGVLEFVHGIQPFGHAGLRADDAGIMSIVVKVNIVIVVVLKPPPVQIQADDGSNEDDQGHNVKREVHKKLPFLGGFRGRRAIVRGVIYSFAGMILLFSGEYKGAEQSLFPANQTGLFSKKPVLPSGGLPRGAISQGNGGNLLSSS